MNNSILNLILFFLLPISSYGQRLSPAFLDSIDVTESYISRTKVDTTISSNYYSLKIEYNTEITIYGNVDGKNRPDGIWKFTFKSDPYKFVRGNYRKGKRVGTWFKDCGSRIFYKKGRLKWVSACSF